MFELAPAKVISPFLRWTGSKRWFTKQFIQDYLPDKFNNYHEPFLGGGAVFFYLKSLYSDKNCEFFLSDSNQDLINCYSRLAEDANLVIKHLKQFKNSELDYYAIRASKPRDEFKKAAKFIYLNRTSFNGIYRVNSMGIYNVPYGKRTNVDVVTEQLFKDIELFLAGCNFQACNFQSTLANIQENDLVFIDPPYTVAHENNGFIEYNQTLFSWEDQIKLKEYILAINEKKAFFILSNASHSSLNSLYEGIGNISKIGRLSKVGGRNKTRGTFNELIIYNTKDHVK